MKTNITLFLLALSIALTVSDSCQNLIGNRWEVTESETVKSTWVERENSGVFDAVFNDTMGRIVTAIYKVSIEDHSVHIQRIYSSNGEFCTIIGKLNSDSNTLNGTCFYPLNNAERSWKAVIKGLKPEKTNLTGRWKCNDNGVYYIRQSNDTIVWYGEQQKETKDFTNVACGTIVRDEIYLNWFDVPNGTILGKGGIILKIISSNTLERISATGDFGGSKWERITTSDNK